MKKQTTIVAVFIFNFLSIMASVEADQIVWSGHYDKTLGLPLSQHLNKISDSLNKDINKTLEEYNVLIHNHHNEICKLTKAEWTQKTQDNITELMLAIDVLEERKTNIAYDFLIHQFSTTSSLIEINAKIKELEKQIKEFEEYLVINNQKVSLKNKRELKGQIFDLENRKNALTRIKTEKVTENIIKNPSLFDAKSAFWVLLSLACSSSPMFAFKIFCNLFSTCGIHGLYLMTGVAPQTRQIGGVMFSASAMLTVLKMSLVYAGALKEF